MPEPIFQGFSKDTLKFFKELARNNKSAWFNANRSRFEAAIKKPAHALMEDLLLGMKKVLPEVRQGKVMRINRDIRFSRDKSPYKTHVAMLLWDDKMQGRGACYLYFHLGGDKLIVGSGVHNFEDGHRAVFRQALVDPKKGAEFSRIVAKLGAYQLGEKAYKKIPKGFDPAHKNAEYLLYNGMYVSAELPVPKEAFGPGLTALCLKHYKQFAPFHRWMTQV
jgi:uncharacterized protein (TIGR02453 family)